MEHTCRMYVDFPPIFGPANNRQRSKTLDCDVLTDDLEFALLYELFSAQMTSTLNTPTR